MPKEHVFLQAGYPWLQNCYKNNKKVGRIGHRNHILKAKTSLILSFWPIFTPNASYWLYATLGYGLVLYQTQLGALNQYCLRNSSEITKISCWKREFSNIRRKTKNAVLDFGYSESLSQEVLRGKKKFQNLLGANPLLDQYRVTKGDNRFAK